MTPVTKCNCQLQNFKLVFSKTVNICPISIVSVMLIINVNLTKILDNDISKL